MPPANYVESIDFPGKRARRILPIASRRTNRIDYLWFRVSLSPHRFGNFLEGF